MDILVIARILARRQPGSFGIRSNVGQRVNAGSARKRIGGAVDMDRNEHRSTEASGDRRPILERQIAIIVASHRHAHPAAIDQLIAERSRKDQRQLLFAQLTGDARCSGVATAVASVDYHDWAAPRRGRAVNPIARRRRQVDGEAGLGRGTPAAVTSNEHRGNHGGERYSNSANRTKLRNPGHRPAK